jgi:hypothetical protein
MSILFADDVQLSMRLGSGGRSVSDRSTGYVIHSPPLCATFRFGHQTTAMREKGAPRILIAARPTRRVQGRKLHDREGFPLYLLPVVQV